MPATALMLALVIIAGASFGVIVARVLTWRAANAPVDVEDEVVAPLRELDVVLAPYRPAA